MGRSHRNPRRPARNDRWPGKTCDSTRSAAMRRRNPRHGMFLVELIFVLALLGVILVLEAQLFNSSLRTVSAVPKVQARAAQLNQMTTALGRDVWSAQGI